MTENSNSSPKLRVRLETDHNRAEAEDASGVEAATLRLILCAVHDRDAEARAHDECGGCEDTVIRDVLELMVRQREESAARYENAGRIELAGNEREEMEIIQRYLPEPMDDETLNEAVASVITDLEAQSLKDLGRCMTELKSRYSDEIDAGKAGKLVKKALAG